jgi:glutaredoxin
MRVEIYSKPDCHLCDEAKRVLTEVRAHLPFELVEINIESDPVLYQRFRYDIPVVFVDGEKAFKHRLDRSAVERRLRRGHGTSVAAPTRQRG